jgi:hypothetical protein
MTHNWVLLKLDPHWYQCGSGSRKPNQFGSKRIRILVRHWRHKKFDFDMKYLHIPYFFKVICHKTHHIYVGTSVVDPRHFRTDSDPGIRTTEYGFTALFVSGWQSFLLITVWRYIYIRFNLYKIKKKSKNTGSWNQGFFYFFSCFDGRLWIRIRTK